MKTLTKAYTVGEGVTTLEGRPVRPGDVIDLTPGQALYHQGLGRVTPKDVAKQKTRAKAAPADSKTPSGQSPDDSSEGGAD